MKELKGRNIPYKIYLTEDEMPKYWYNVRADMTNKPAPLLNPGTLKPVSYTHLDVYKRQAFALIHLRRPLSSRHYTAGEGTRQVRTETPPTGQAA